MDRFDDIWRNKFQHEDSGAESWNTPSDKSWQAIVSGIEKEKRRKMLLPFIISLLLFFTLSLGYLMNLKPDTSVKYSELPPSGDAMSIFADLEIKYSKFALPIETDERFSYVGKISSHKENIILHEVSETSSSSATASEGITESIQRTELGIDSTQPLSSETNSKKIIKGFSVLEGSLNHSRTLPQIDSKINSTNESNQQLPLEEFFKSSYVFAPPNIDLAARESILFLTNTPINFLSFKTHQNQFANYLNLLEWEGSTSKTNYWKVGLFIGGSIWQQQLSSSYLNALEPFDFKYTKNNLGSQLGLDMSRGLNEKLELYFQPGYYTLSGESGHNSSISYFVSAESQDDHSNFYSLNMATPFGPAGAEFKLLRKGETSVDEVALMPVLISEQRISAFSLPIGLRYFPLNQFNRMNPFVNFGLRYNQFIHLKNQLKNLEIGHDLFEYIPLENQQSLSRNLKKHHFDLSIGFGIQFYFENNFHLNINYQFSHGWSKINLPEINNSYLNSHSMNFSIIKKLTKNK